MPSRNGCVTEDPGDRHNIQAGATLDAAADAAADDPVREADAPVGIAAVAPDKSRDEFDVDAEAPAALEAVAAVCAITASASAIGADSAIQKRIASDSLPVPHDVRSRRLPAR